MNRALHSRKILGLRLTLRPELVARVLEKNIERGHRAVAIGDVLLRTAQPPVRRPLNSNVRCHHAHISAS